MPSVTQLHKPANAGWIAKAVINPAGDLEIGPAPAGAQAHDFEFVEIAWYGRDRLKVTLKDGGPAHIRQAYLSGSGQHVILDLVRAPTID